MDDLKPCPFCGKPPDREYGAGTVFNPDSYWDSGMRGEEYGFVMCSNCGVILKADSLKEAIDRWNQRKRTRQKSNIEPESTTIGPIGLAMERLLKSTEV